MTMTTTNTEPEFRFHCHGCGFATYVNDTKEGPACSRCGFINSRPHIILWDQDCTCRDCGEHIVNFSPRNSGRII